MAASPLLAGAFNALSTDPNSDLFEAAVDAVVEILHAYNEPSPASGGADQGDLPVISFIGTFELVTLGVGGCGEVGARVGWGRMMRSGD